VAQKDTCTGRKREDLLDRVVQLRGIPTGKVAARRAGFRRKDGGPDKRRVTDQISEAILGVTRCRQHPHAQFAGHQFIAVLQQAIKLMAVGNKLVT
jgi:hypothetical protein